MLAVVEMRVPSPMGRGASSTAAMRTARTAANSSLRSKVGTPPGTPQPEGKAHRCLGGRPSKPAVPAPVQGKIETPSLREVRMPPVTQALIVANVIVFLLEMSGPGGGLIDAFALWPTPSAVLVAPWRLVTYSFLHGSLGHVFFNMFAVYMFGGDLERLWGGKRFAWTWFASVITAALTQVVVGTLSGVAEPVIGASGGVFGLLLCYGLIFPNRQLILLFPPIPMPAKVFVTLYGALELFLGVLGIQTGVAHFAHLGGMLGGWLMLRYYKGSRRRW